VSVDSYVELAAAVDPHGCYACVWSRFTGAGEPVLQRVVPDACMDVIWHRESGSLFVAGPDTEPHVAPATPGTLVGLRFSPGSAPGALDLPAAALRDGRVDLDAVWPAARARVLAERLAETATVAGAQRLLERELAVDYREPDPAAAEVLRLLRFGSPIGQLAADIGLSERQLHRRSLAAFGYGPKVLQRVLRFDLAVRLARLGVPFADTAHRAGYADQAHLSREVRALAGVPLRTLLWPAAGRMRAAS
jgi:AraC-like DNA-binding protein